MNKLFGPFLLAIACWAPDLAQAANRFAVCTAACTWDSSSTAMWSTTTGGGTGASVPGSSDVAIFDGATCVGGVTCTITVDATVNGATLQGITAGACTASTTGCIINFSGNPSITLSGTTAMNLTGTGTRKYLFGSGTFTLTSTSAGAPYDVGTTTNLDAASDFTAPIVYSATTANERQFNGGGRTFGSLTIGANTSRGGVRIFSNNTFSSISIPAGTTLQLPSGTTTITSAGSMGTGTSSTPILITPGASTSGTATLSFSGAVTLDWIGLVGITTTGAGTFTATNCLNFGRVTLDSGDTCSAPSGTGGGGRIIGG